MIIIPKGIVCVEPPMSKQSIPRFQPDPRKTLSERQVNDY